MLCLWVYFRAIWWCQKVPSFDTLSRPSTFLFQRNIHALEIGKVPLQGLFFWRLCKNASEKSTHLGINTSNWSQSSCTHQPYVGYLLQNSEVFLSGMDFLVCQLLCKVFIIWSIFCPGVTHRWQQLLIDNFVGYDTILMNSLLSASGRGICHSMLQGFHSFVRKSWCNCNKTQNKCDPKSDFIC